MRTTTMRGLAAPVALAMVLLACGQKPGVHVETGPLAQGGTPGAPGTVAGDDGMAFDDGLGEQPVEGDAVDLEVVEGEDVDVEGGGEVAAGDPGEGGATDGSGSAGDGGGTTGGGAEGGGGAAGGGSGGGGGGDGGGGGARQPQGSDRTGVTDAAITLAIHAPVTGAAPLPSTSFEKSRDLYWRWVTEGKGEKVLGRDKVEVIFADDRYDPNSAIQVCRNLAARAFLLMGGGGTDQIQACGRRMGQERVPYFSAGVTETGLEGNPWYFAASMTYKQQTELLAQYVKKNYPGKKVGAIVTQTPNFNDAVAGWEAAVKRHGLPYTTTHRHPKGDTTWYSTLSADLEKKGAEVVFILTSPLDYIRFAQTAEKDFQFVGVGVSKGLNDVLRSGCPHVGKGTFLSPFPALETAGKFDPEFQQAASKFGVAADDIAWAIWGASKLQHAAFKRYEQTFGNDLTREDFRALVESAGKLSTGVYPDVNYRPDNHFGGTGVHVLRADCGSRTYKDGGTFKSGF
ncbi:ABC transporter substrate-binding protein [Egicoccus sp. AB-alg6-2]|uniref:ABC transporter substrate-binding protein n=1 Tax=Egicoccus sp. AB-alg6-2 TaxID=3242692 RepID=UPI00359E7B04